MKFEDSDNIVRQLIIHGHNVKDITAYTNEELRSMLFAIGEFIDECRDEERQIFKEMCHNAKGLSQSIKSIISYREDNKELLEAIKEENQNILDIINKVAEEENL